MSSELIILSSSLEFPSGSHPLLNSFKSEEFVQTNMLSLSTQFHFSFSSLVLKTLWTSINSLNYVLAIVL